MISLEYIIIITIFVVYYFSVLISEKRIIKEPHEIIGKFLSTILLYAGISLIYYSLIGKPLFGAAEENYKIYIFIMGFVAILWTIPELLDEFEFFRKFVKKSKKK